ncbi:MAG: phage coat protein, partial [Clostridia bacterium]|nr:phage coat protein [Clostridia bacterium]
KGNNEIRNAFSDQTGTAYAILPMYGRIGGEVLNYDGLTDISAENTSSFERGVVVVGRAKAWLENDFSEDITGGAKFMDNVAMQVSDYFDDVDQKTMLSILQGIFNMTGSKNLEFVNQHTYDISNQTGEGAFANATTLNNAIQKASGDNKNKFSVVIMHSKVATNLENLNLLGYLKQTDQSGIQRDLTLASWNGRIVLIDDDMPTNEKTDYTEYTTYILGEGSFDYEDIGAKVPFEMDRNPQIKGGQDTLYARTRKCFAPYGISYTKTNQVSLSPTNEELSDGSNWELVNNGLDGSEREYIDHKAIAIARIISRG